MTWWSEALDQIARGQACVLVTVCTVKGSAPREPGAKMLVWLDGQDGTVGGGKLEFTIVEQARRMLDGDQRWRFQNYPLGPLLGQCCGGNVGLLLERLDGESGGWLTDIAAAEAVSRPYCIVSQLGVATMSKQIGGVVPGKDIGLVEDTVSVRFAVAGSVAGAIAEGATIVEHIAPCPHLLMFGAGHVGRALAPIVATLPFHLDWFDTRPEFSAPGVTITNDAVGKVPAAPPGAFALIFTQSHALDYDLTRAVLARGDFAYCGLIGSATKRARFEKRLIADGISSARLSALTCPIGEIGLDSKLPQVMAVAIAAELMLVREAQARQSAEPARTKHAL
jgi:xanthine dehydrogenase accessory factor